MSCLFSFVFIFIPILFFYFFICPLGEQGREVSVFCRLWLVNRTEIALQHRDASLAMGVDATFMGDRMPQVSLLC